jgi:hypothetical protein
VQKRSYWKRHDAEDELYAQAKANSPYQQYLAEEVEAPVPVPEPHVSRPRSAAHSQHYQPDGGPFGDLLRDLNMIGWLPSLAAPPNRDGGMEYNTRSLTIDPRRVRLTADEVAIAKACGLSVEQFAKQKIRLAQRKREDPL